MDKKDKLKKAILTGRVKDEKSMAEFILEEQKKEELILEVKNEVIAEIKNNLPQQKDEEIEVTLEII